MTQKWSSSNTWYAIILVPLLLLNAWLAFSLLRPSVWAWLVPMPAAFAALWILLRMRHLPRPASAYARMKKADAFSPNFLGVEVFFCPEMDRYDFLLRVAEFISPMTFAEGARPKVAISPRLFEACGRDFMEVAVAREVESYRLRTRLKIILHLATPVLLIAATAMLVAMNAPHFARLGAFATDFILPALFSGAFVLHILLWNKSVSRHDRIIDARLAEWFHSERIKSYIATIEELENARVDSRHRPFNAHYARERIQGLDNGR